MKLLHGDCLELMKDIPDASVDMVLTDPPYGITTCKWDSAIPFEPMWAQLNRIIKKNGAIVLFGSEPFSSLLRVSNLKMFKYDWIWEKDNGTGFLNAKKQPLKVVETISVFYKSQCSYNPQMRLGYKPYKTTHGATKTENYGKQTGAISVSNGERYPLNLIKFPRDKTNKIHPTQKPVALLEYLIKTYTQENEVVLDFTMGSGSTGVACINTNRKFIGIEKVDKYFEFAEKRVNEAIQAYAKSVNSHKT